MTSGEMTSGEMGESEMSEPRFNCGRPNMRHSALKQSARRAFSLLEVVATLSVLLVIALTAASMLGSITNIGLRYRHAFQERESVRRFAEAFRADISNTVDVVTADNRWPLELVSQEHVVEYRWDPSSKQLFRLVRSPSDGDAPAEILATDVYPLTDRCRPRLVIAEDRVSVILRETQDAPGWIVEAPR